MITKDEIIEHIEHIEQKYFKPKTAIPDNVGERNIMIWGACERSVEIERYANKWKMGG